MRYLVACTTYFCLFTTNNYLYNTIIYDRI
nr:MAG TPA: hypothetical protein [Caudoviricetes sp.]